MILAASLKWRWLGWSCRLGRWLCCRGVGPVGTRIFERNQSSILMEDWVNGWSSGYFGTGALRNFMSSYGLLLGRDFVRILVDMIRVDVCCHFQHQSWLGRISS